jgi:5-methylthioribose kinase
MAYQILDKESVQTFVKTIPTLRELFGEGQLSAEEIGDGNVNFVFIVRALDDPKKAVIVKQAVPYLRIAGEGFPLSRERMTYEIRALQNYAQLAAQYIPTLYYADEAMSLVVMEYLDNCIIMRKGLIDSTVYTDFSEHITTFLAHTLFYNSSLYLSSSEKRALMDQFNANTELCKLTEDFVFTFPYMESETNVIELSSQEEAKALFAQMDYKENLLKLKYAFMTQHDALLHGDLHTGSIMIDAERTYVIDPEFAFVGPFGFDIGALIANLINAYIAHLVTTDDSAYQAWLLQTIEAVYAKFEKKFLALWNAQASSALVTPGFIDAPALEAYQQAFMRNIYQQSIGFAGAKMARRVFGIAGVAEIRGIEDPIKRKEASMMALRVGIDLIKSYESMDGVEALITKLKAVA